MNAEIYLQFTVSKSGPHLLHPGIIGQEKKVIINVLMNEDFKNIKYGLWCVCGWLFVCVCICLWDYVNVFPCVSVCSYFKCVYCLPQ